MAGWLWIVVAVGIAALGIAMIFGVFQSDRFRPHREAVRRSESATERVHDREERRSER